MNWSLLRNFSDYEAEIDECDDDVEEDALDSIISLLSDIELMEQDELLCMLPNGGGAEDITDSLIFGDGPHGESSSAKGYHIDIITILQKY